jgi:hypothetical protein
MHMEMNMIPGWTRDGYGYDNPNTPSNRIHEVAQPDPITVKSRVLHMIRSDFQICGLYCGSHGRSCYKHNICGHKVVVGNILRLSYVTVPVLCGLLQRRIAAVLLNEEGADTCTVGFITPRLYEEEYLHHYVGTSIQVARLGAEAPGLRELQDDELFCGLADCFLLATNKDVIPVMYNS